MSQELPIAAKAFLSMSLKLLMLIVMVLQHAFLFPSQVRGTEEFSFSQPLTVRWQYQSTDTVNLTPVAESESVYLPLAGGSLVSLQMTSGELRWKADVGGEFSASPVADERGVYVASEIAQQPSPTNQLQANGAIRAVGRKSGVTRWMRTLHFPLRGDLAGSPDAIFGGSTDGRVYAISKETGDTLWVKELPAPFYSQPVLGGGRLYLGDDKGTLWVLDQKTGRTIWRYQTHGSIRGAVALFGQLVYFGSGDGYVYALKQATGKLRWRRRTGAGVQAITYSQNGIVVASLDNFVYFLSANKGDLLWKRLLPGRIAARPLPDGVNVLFAPLSGDACIVLALKDGKQTNTLLVGEGNNTAAAPIIVGELVLVTTRTGMVAFAPASPKREPPNK